jgi:oxaloacetate decarboxylase alpha subunit
MKEKGIGKSEEDVLSYALFPQVAEKFFKVRDAEDTVRNIVVEDLGL